MSHRYNHTQSRVRTVLLADEDAQVRRAVRAQLEAAGFDVLEATDGVRALDRMREDIAAVVVDLKLTGAAGLNVLSDVRARFPDTPVILLSEHGNVPEAVEAMRFGAAKYLAKPFHPEEVLTAVRQSLRAAGLARTTTTGHAGSNPRITNAEDAQDAFETEESPCEETPGRPSLAGYTMEQIECWALIDTLKSVGGNKAAAARALGVCEKTVYNKLKRMRLQGRHE